MSDEPTFLFMMTIENIHGRETLYQLLKYNIPINCIIIEHKSKLAENSRNYLKNDFYDPGSFDSIVNGKKIDTYYVENHNDEQTLQILKKYEPDYILLGGTRILKEPIIKSVKFGVLNSHPAILPKYRGLDCIPWSILAGDPVGATVHYIDPGVDSGPIILQETIDYSDCDSLIKVRISVMKKCAELMVRAILGMHFNTLKPNAQDSSLSIKHESISSDKLALIEEKISNQYRADKS